MTAALVATVWGGHSGWTPWVAVGVCAVAVLAAGLRWLRVAQREHYLADAVSRFALRWWVSQPANWALAVIGLAGLGVGARWPLAALASGVVAAVGPVHLTLRGRTSKLVFTRRLKTLTAVWLVLEAAVLAAGVLLGAPAPFAAAACLGAPVLVDLALAATSPLERRLSEHFVQSAADRLRRVDPLIVAITGSYGKTSTKNYVAHLASGTRQLVATPASFNNRGGLARSVNEHLSEGTEVFVAEMGTYGPGEIRDLCAWCPPTIAVLTAIGPVHLERFGTEEAIVTAKAEITERAGVVIVNGDDPRLAQLGASLAAAGGRQVLRCSAVDPRADVAVLEGEPGALGRTVTVYVGGVPVATDVVVAEGVQSTNLACAVAVAVQLGVPAEALAGRIATLPQVPNRLAAALAPSGVYIIDDTFNSNPAGARAALSVLAAAPVSGRRVLVTPGMIELGHRQSEENERFARQATGLTTDLVVVGRTNRRPLVRGVVGAGGASRRPVIVRTRDEAVAWVRGQLGPGDAVLYENDLPDQYP